MTYGAGFGIEDDWITKQFFWRVDEAIAEFRQNHFDQMAQGRGRVAIQQRGQARPVDGDDPFGRVEQAELLGDRQILGTWHRL